MKYLQTKSSSGARHCNKNLRHQCVVKKQETKVSSASKTVRNSLQMYKSKASGKGTVKRLLLGTSIPAATTFSSTNNVQLETTYKRNQNGKKKSTGYNQKGVSMQQCYLECTQNCQKYVPLWYINLETKNVAKMLQMLTTHTHNKVHPKGVT